MMAFVAGFSGTLHAIVRDRSAVVTLVGSTILYSFYYPSPYAHQVAAHLPVAVVDLDRSPLSRALVRSTMAVRAVRVVDSPASLREAEVLLNRGKVQGIVVITANFQREILRGHQGEVALFGDGARLGPASTTVTGLADALSGFGVEAAVRQASFAGPRGAPIVQLIQRPLFNTREGYGSTIVPAVTGLIIHQIAVIGIVLLVGTRQESGRLALSIPAMLGSVTAFSIIGATGLLYYQGFVFWFQDYPRTGSLGPILLVTILYTVTFTTFATFLASFSRSRERAFQFIGLTSPALFFLTGVSWPIPSIPPALNALAQLLPTTSGVTAMVKVNQMGATLAETGPEMFTLFLLTVLYVGLTAWRYRQHAAHESLCRV